VTNVFNRSHLALGKSIELIGLINSIDTANKI